MRYQMIGVAGVAAVGLLAAACSSGSSTATSSPSAPASHTASGQAATTTAAISLRTIARIPHPALVDSHGRTLYLFEADKNGKPACSGACATAWPPDTATGMPHAGSGINQTLLGTVKRSDGATQITYNGHPLYYFSGDTGAGTAMGQGANAFGAGWYVVGASGSKIDTS
jgi:predicted lipoprotein with Yx(FWY)xxD motif